MIVPEIPHRHHLLTHTFQGFWRIVAQLQKGKHGEIRQPAHAESSIEHTRRIINTGSSGFEQPAKFLLASVPGKQVHHFGKLVNELDRFLAEAR